MRRHFFFSDPHFGHGNIMKYSRRLSYLQRHECEMMERGEDFKVSPASVARMNEALLDSLNHLVQPDDVLWCLGDWCWAPQDAYFEEARRFRERISCRTVHFIWGNHDSRMITSLFSSTHDLALVAIDPTTGDHVIGEEEIYANFARYRNWQMIVLCHYLMAAWNGSHKGNWHLYGHSHASAENWADTAMKGRRSLDVGIDNAYRLLGEYRPFRFEELREILGQQPGFGMVEPRA